MLKVYFRGVSTDTEQETLAKSREEFAKKQDETWCISSRLQKVCKARRILWPNKSKMNTYEEVCSAKF
jgi:hypothetical protein